MGKVLQTLVGLVLLALPSAASAQAAFMKDDLHGSGISTGVLYNEERTSFRTQFVMTYNSRFDVGGVAELLWEDDASTFFVGGSTSIYPVRQTQTGLPFSLSVDAAYEVTVSSNWNLRVVSLGGTLFSDFFGDNLSETTLQPFLKATWTDASGTREIEVNGFTGTFRDNLDNSEWLWATGLSVYFTAGNRAVWRLTPGVTFSEDLTTLSIIIGYVFSPTDSW